MVRLRDLAIAPAAEGALILLLGGLGWAAQQPLLFASLGPTAYEIVEWPLRKSARPYSVIAGHMVALAAAWGALVMCHGLHSPSVATAGTVVVPRIWAAVISVMLTTAVTLAIGASQPAALSTTLLVALGAMQTVRAALDIVVAVLILVAAAEPIRRVRAQLKRSAQP